MVKGKVTAAATHAERKALRSTLGALTDLRVGKRAKARYVRAVNYFLWWVVALYGQMANSYEALDQHAVAFIQAAWNEGGPKSVVADMLSGLGHLLDKKRIVPTAWSWLTTWERHEMPVRAPPLSAEIVFALAGLAWTSGFLEISCLLPIAFAAMLRTAEICELKASDVRFYKHKAAISLSGKSAARTGDSESVVVDDAVALRMLRMLCASKQPGELLLGGGGGLFRRRWKWLIGSLQLDSSVYQPYGLRRGGACEDFAVFGDAGRLCLRGRWSSIKTARIYAQEALRVRQLSELSQAQEALIQYWARVFAQRFASLS